MKKNTDAETLLAKLQSIQLGDTISIGKREMHWINKLAELLDYHIPKPVTDYITRPSMYDPRKQDFYDLCPRCRSVAERTYQAHCASCGQFLKWPFMWSKSK
jgi:hypothetical protein